VDGGGMITGRHYLRIQGFKLTVGSGSTLVKKSIRSDLSGKGVFYRSGVRGQLTGRPVVLEYREFILLQFTR
jgi:hypothetical protein